MSGRPGARGHLAEARAEAWLTERGLVAVARNYRCPGGELDLVMRDGETLVFVEVRLRADADALTLAESIDQRKRARLRRAASHYLQRHHAGAEPPCRFDAVLMTGDAASCEPLWVRQAFEA